MSEMRELLWIEQERRHPEFAELTNMPFAELVALAAKDVADETSGSQTFTDDPSGEWAIYGGRVAIAENPHATEQVHVFVSKRSTSLIYESRYKGVIGQVIEPTATWAVSLDSDGSLYYWDQSRHGETASLFTLAATECDQIASNSLAVMVMQEYLARGMYLRNHPEVWNELGHSRLPPLNLKDRIGIH
jgi:hypothetical protein